MSKTTLIVIIYVLGLIFGTLALSLWGTKIGPVNAVAALVWTIIFLITLFYAEKKNNN
jgi:hypothetical protein